MKNQTRQMGLSLVEIMVALTLGLFLLGGIISVYISSKATYRVTDASSRMQENARFAMDIITRDVRMAGYTGCASRLSAPVNTLNNSTSYNYNFNVGLQGFQASGASWSPALDTSISGATPAPLAGTDVIVIRRADNSGINVESPWMNTNASALHISTGNGLSNGDIVMVSDCSGSSIMQNTNANPDTSGTLDHNTGVGSPGNSTPDLGRIYKGDAEVLRLYSVTYYIASSSGRTSLWRKIGANTPEELVEGVQDMQILYGDNTDDDENQATNKYVTADQVDDINNVVGVRISLLLQSSEDNITQQAQAYAFNGATTTPGDKRLRRVFTTTINLRNRTS